MSDTKTLILDLPEEIALRLAEVATATRRSPAEVVLDALRHYLELDTVRAAETPVGVEETYREDYDAENDAEIAFSRWQAREID